VKGGRWLAYLLALLLLLGRLHGHWIWSAVAFALLYPCSDSRDVTAHVDSWQDLQEVGRRPLPVTLDTYRREEARWQAAKPGMDQRPGL